MLLASCGFEEPHIQETPVPKAYLEVPTAAQVSRPSGVSSSAPARVDAFTSTMGA